MIQIVATIFESYLEPLLLVLFALGENQSAVGFHLDLLVGPSSVENVDRIDRIVGHAFHQLAGVNDEAKTHKSVVVSCCQMWLSPGELGNFRAPRDVDQLKENAQ